jgi:hypothetical protein
LEQTVWVVVGLKENFQALAEVQISAARFIKKSSALADGLLTGQVKDCFLVHGPISGLSGDALFK